MDFVKVENYIIHKCFCTRLPARIIGVIRKRRAVNRFDDLTVKMSCSVYLILRSNQSDIQIKLISYKTQIKKFKTPIERINLVDNIIKDSYN